MANITIVGAGFMGTALTWPLCDNGHRVRLVGTHLDAEIIASCREKRFHPKLRRALPEGVQPYYVEQTAEALQDADVIVSGVNSMGVHWIGRTLGPLLWPGATVIAVTKGLEATAGGDLHILPDVLHDELPAALRDRVTLAAIGGPCIAGELAGRRQTCVVFGSRDKEVLERLRDIFRTSYYHIWLSTDLVGVEVCAALKNAYTLAVGLASGILERSGGVDEAGAWMHNTAAALFGVSNAEMSRLVALLGGDPAKVPSLPGAGDQYVTCAGGRTVRMGRLLGMGRTYSEAVIEMAGETLEGAWVVGEVFKVLPEWEARGWIGPRDLPLMRLLGRVITQEAPLEIAFDEFLGGYWL